MGHYVVDGAAVLASVRLHAWGGEESPTVLRLEVEGILAGPELQIAPSGNRPVFLHYPLELTVGAGARLRCRCVRAPGPDGQARRICLALGWVGS